MSWQWHTHQFRAMNTDVFLKLFSQTEQPVLKRVERLFRSFEQRLSRFQPNSELSQLNASNNPVFSASPVLLDAVEVALWGSVQTGGLYDPTILSHLERAGYDRSFEQVTNPQPLSVGQLSTPTRPTPATKPGWGTSWDITVNRPRREIHKPVGMRLDLGGMGKGWTVDRAADQLQGIGPFLVNAGGDLYAYHSPPGEAGWEISLTHPLEPGETFAQLRLHQQALATSTIARRRWQQDGTMQHHLIDPRTGCPAETDAVSVSVIGPRTVQAEIQAKAALILGVETGLAYLTAQPGFEGLIFGADGQVVMTEGFGAKLR